MGNLRCCTSMSEVDSYVQPETLLNHTCSLEEILQILCVKMWQSKLTNPCKIKPDSDRDQLLGIAATPESKPTAVVPRILAW